MLQLWRIAKALGTRNRIRDVVVVQDRESEIQTFSRIITSCGRDRDLARGREIHGYILQGKHCRNIYLSNLLIAMYGKCGCVRDAIQIFQGMAVKNTYTGNIMIQVLTENGYTDLARDLFDSWQDRTIISWKIMISAYAKLGNLVAAKDLFDGMPQSDVISWTVMIVAYSDSGNVALAVEMFEKMPQWDSVSWSSMIVAYAQSGYVDAGRRMLDNRPQANYVSWTAMVTAYGQHGRAEDAKKLFDAMPDKDVVAWKAMLTAYAQNGHVGRIKELYERIPVLEESIVNFMIMVYAQNNFVDEAEEMLSLLTAETLSPEACTAMIIASSKGKRLERARFLYSSMKNRDVMLSTAMIAACGESGLVREARDLFEEIASKDSVAWTTMIDAYAGNGYLREALDLFFQMPRKCVIPWSALIAGYARAGNLCDSNDIFERFPEHNVVSCTAMLQAYALAGDIFAARDIFDGMLHRDKSCWAIMVAACTDNHHPTMAFDLLDRMPEWENFNAMIVAYAHKGCMDQSKDLFETLEVRDSSSWTAMIAGHACNGQSNEALEAFWCMNQDGFEADEVTFISVLHACSHTGMVARSLDQFVSMSLDHFGNVLKPVLEHYHCIVDVLCRAGHLEEAEELVVQMPLEPDCVPWTTLLGGCRTHGDIERGWRVAGKVFELDPAPAAHYMLLCNIYLENGEVS